MAKATTAGKQSKSARVDAAKGEKLAKSKPAKPAKSGKNETPGVWGRFTGYLRGVRAEMTRVVWPTREEVLNSSLVVVVTLLFFIAFTFLVDQVVVYALSLVNRIGG